MKEVTFTIDFCDETFRFPDSMTEEEIDDAFDNWFDRSVCCGWEECKE